MRCKAVVENLMGMVLVSLLVSVSGAVHPAIVPARNYQVIYSTQNIVNDAVTTYGVDAHADPNHVMFHLNNHEQLWTELNINMASPVKVNYTNGYDYLSRFALFQHLLPPADLFDFFHPLQLSKGTEIKLQAAFNAIDQSVVVSTDALNPRAIELDIFQLAMNLFFPLQVKEEVGMYEDVDKIIDILAKIKPISEAVTAIDLHQWKEAGQAIVSLFQDYFLTPEGSAALNDLFTKATGGTITQSARDALLTELRQVYFGISLGKAIGGLIIAFIDLTYSKLFQHGDPSLTLKTVSNVPTASITALDKGVYGCGSGFSPVMEPFALKNTGYTADHHPTSESFTWSAQVTSTNDEFHLTDSTAGTLAPGENDNITAIAEHMQVGDMITLTVQGTFAQGSITITDICQIG